jgi:hypothetical protein
MLGLFLLLLLLCVAQQQAVALLPPPQLELPAAGAGTILPNPHFAWAPVCDPVAIVPTALCVSVRTFGGAAYSSRAVPNVLVLTKGHTTVARAREPPPTAARAQRR